MKKSFCIAMALLAGVASAQPKFRVLVFNKYGVKSDGSKIEHESIYTLSAAVLGWAKDLGFDAVASVDPKDFNATNLAKFQVVMFNNSPLLGTTLNADQKAAYLAWAPTHGTVAVHSGGDNRATWTDFSPGMLGCEFAGHGTGNASVTGDAEGKDHPVMTGAGLGTNMVLETSLKMNDEMYSFTANPRGLPNLKILYTMDEKTFPADPKMGADHPITWVRDLAGGGRLFYTGWGHSTAMSTNAFFKKLIVNSLFWAGKADQSSVVRPGMLARSGAPRFSVEAAAGSLTVFLGEEGFHVLQLSTFDGRSAGRFAGAASAYTFSGLPGAAPYTLTVTSPGASGARVIAPR